MINYKFSLEVKIWVLINIQLKNEMNSTYRLLTTYFAKSLRFAQIYRVLSKTNGTIINTDLQGTICKANEKSVQSQESISYCPNVKVNAVRKLNRFWMRKLSRITFYLLFQPKSIIIQNHSETSFFRNSLITCMH